MFVVCVNIILLQINERSELLKRLWERGQLIVLKVTMKS